MLFFILVTVTTALVLHPVITGISLAAACAYAILLKGRKALIFCLAFVLPLILIVAVLNPLFNHAGVTPLFYLKNGNAVTLEAIIYGINSACMFAALVLWFFCLSTCMTSDKYVYLFGKVVPTLSLLFSMVLRFVPRLFARIRDVSNAQKSVSPEFKKSPVNALRHGVSVISSTVSWALESAVNVSDSMKSRGYGLPGRTSYAIYRFDARDAVLSAILGCSFILSAAAMAFKHIRFRCYPSILFIGTDALAAAGYAAFALFCAAPVILNLKEDIEWRFLKSRI
jgi:energy-coupling factor transport system permease protein